MRLSYLVGLIPNFPPKLADEYLMRTMAQHGEPADPSETPHTAGTGVPGETTLYSLANRSVLREAIEQLYEPGRSCSLIVVDIDDFTRCNTRMGHTAGNEILVAIGERLRNVAGADIIGRVDGRFIIFQEDTDGRSLAHAFVEAVRDPMSVTESLSGEHMVLLTASAGVALGPTHGSTLADLFHSAEHAVGRAKDAGGDRAQCSLLRSLQPHEVPPASQQLAATMRELISLLSPYEHSQAWLQNLAEAYEGARTGGRSEFIALGEMQFAEAEPTALKEDARCTYLHQRAQELALVLARSARAHKSVAS